MLHTREYDKLSLRGPADADDVVYICTVRLTGRYEFRTYLIYLF